MNEKDVLKQSVKVFIGGLIIFSIVGFVLKQISFPLGFILGYAVSVLSFYIIIVIKRKCSILCYCNLISVFFGYFVTKITINILGYIKR